MSNEARKGLASLLDWLGENEGKVLALCPNPQDLKRSIASAWSLVRAPESEGLDLEVIAHRVRHAEHESDCRLEAPPMEATGPRVCTCIVSDAAEMLRRLRAGAEGGGNHG